MKQLLACSWTPVLHAVETLHDQLRDCVDLMGIGLGGQRSDTVAEEGTAVTKDQPKDTGDVRSAPASTGKLCMWVPCAIAYCTMLALLSPVPSC